MLTGPNRNVAIVAIGRNEGDRLKRCLRSAMKGARTVVYVDSGSLDGSAAYARSVGCRVNEVDPLRPFSAARARNEGFASVIKHDPDVAFVQFVDGDCELVDGWLERGLATLAEKQEVAVVCGHIREAYPEATVYNKMCDLEWQHPPGEVLTCSGRFMIRKEVFSAVGGFRADVIAAEDDELCVRVRSLGWKILLVDAAMAHHDASMTRFSEWWRRAKRSGHAYAQVAALHGKGEERYFVRDCRKIWLWGLVFPAVALCAAPFTYGLSLALLLGLYSLQFARIHRHGEKRGWRAGDAATYALFTVLSRFPALTGLLAYHWRRWRGHPMTIIEPRRNSAARSYGR